MGGVREALRAAQGRGGDLPLTVEVRDMKELAEALDSGAGWIMLDNFSLEQLAAAVRERGRRGREVILEASGGIGPDNIAAVAATGVDRISCGALTKNIKACDFSMQITSSQVRP